MGRTWCAYCRRRGHSLYEDRVNYIVIVCVKSRICGRCFESHEFLTALFSARTQLPSDNGTFILLCRNLWELDRRLEHNNHYMIRPRLTDLDESGSTDDTDDVKVEGAAACDPSKGPFFENLKEGVLETQVFKTFIRLLELYDTAELASEICSDTTSQSVKFLKEILKEHCSKRLHFFLTERGLVGSTEKDMMEKLTNIWFHHTKHRGRLSCAFQRIFIGGLKVDKDHQKLTTDGFISGIHNWVRFYLLERDGYIKYNGVHGKQSPSNKKEMMNIEFGLDRKIIKPVGSTFIGTTPAFDICLYTAAFLAGCKEGHTYIRLGSHNVDLYCPSNVPNGDDDITTCYPVED
ncbi:poly(U)-specific endoribonuclease-A-like [Glandiceps talaboti]